MFDVASSQSGAVVSIATSNDENFPASTVIDGNDKTFWMTTGLYPQSFVITFPQTVEIKGMQLISFGIKYLVVEKSSSNHPIDFDPISEKTLTSDERKLQKSDISFNKTHSVRHIKITILSGYDSFASVHHVRVDGKAPR